MNDNSLLYRKLRRDNISCIVRFLNLADWPELVLVCKLFAEPLRELLKPGNIVYRKLYFQYVHYQTWAPIYYSQPHLSAELLYGVMLSPSSRADKKHIICDNINQRLFRFSAAKLVRRERYIYVGPANQKCGDATACCICEHWVPPGQGHTYSRLHTLDYEDIPCQSLLLNVLMRLCQSNYVTCDHCEWSHDTLRDGIKGVPCWLSQDDHPMVD